MSVDVKKVRVLEDAFIAAVENAVEAGCARADATVVASAAWRRCVEKELEREEGVAALFYHFGYERVAGGEWRLRLSPLIYRPRAFSFWEDTLRGMHAMPLVSMGVADHLIRELRRRRVPATSFSSCVFVDENEVAIFCRDDRERLRRIAPAS